VGERGGSERGSETEPRKHIYIYSEREREREKSERGSLSDGEGIIRPRGTTPITGAQSVLCRTTAVDIITPLRLFERKRK